MASSGKKKTTMAKLSRESRLRERRVEKQARKLARKQASTLPQEPFDGRQPEDDGSGGLTGENPEGPLPH